jgi:hypothetical protein
MSIKIERNSQTLLGIKILLVVSASFLLYLVANFYYLRWASYNDIKNGLEQTDARIKGDLVYKNGKWDTSAYDNDLLIQQNNPLYIITTNGFVIDRESPINGLLNTSNFQYSSSFTDPKTVTSPSSEQWRMYSEPIIKNKTIKGVVTVGYLQPDPEATKDIDNKLRNAASTIVSKIKMNGDTLEVSNVDARNININISYEIVDKFNRSLASVGGVPSYIDTSYLPELLKGKSAVVTDSITGASFATLAVPILDKTNNPVGMVVSGYPLKQVNDDLAKQLLFSISSGAVVIVFMLFLLGYLIRKDLRKFAHQLNETISNTLPLMPKNITLTFNKENSKITFADKLLKVPYDSNQYYVCKVLFSNTKKRWENDEIVEKIFPEVGFEEVNKYWRKVYDAIRGLNEKSQQEFGFDIVIFEAKTCRINPNLPSVE